ncbi:MAG: DNA breaking-rejoining protein [Pseudomonadota bacterium]
MRHTLIPIAVLLLIAGSVVANEELRTEALSFDGTTAIAEDDLTGYEIVDYSFEAKAGQFANISMATKHLSNYFNILPPGSEGEAIYIGSINGNQFEGILEQSGRYQVRVYLMRNAARRNEKATYRLEVILADPATSNGTGGRLGGLPFLWRSTM